MYVYMYMQLKYACTKGNPKVRSPYVKMTSQAKNFVVMMKVIIIIVNTNNIRERTSDF